MGQSERSLTDLGRHVAALQDRAPEAKLDRAEGRARLLDAAPRPTRSLPVRFVVSLAAAALLAGALALVFVTRSRAPLRFALGAGEPGVAGAWIAAPEAAELPIRFSDGSLLRLAPGGRARVTTLDADGAEIALERGTLDLAIVHRAVTRWMVRVGPFQVHVVGTRFETRWDPASEQLTVALREGAITVSGPVVGDARAVHAGERLTISTAKRTLEVGMIDEAPPAAIPSTAEGEIVDGGFAAPMDDGDSGARIDEGASAAKPPIQEALPRSGASAADSASSPLRPAAPGWRPLARDAKYKDALAAAELEGFDAICAAASAGDLRALGDAARLGGNAARASQAFTALRTRFPGSPEAAAAAFILGRMAQDRSRDYASAAAWFTRYLSERPGGEFAAEASGRLIEAEDKMGGAANARRAAERYLAAYPNGAHAAYARSVLARGAPPASPPP